MSGAGVADRRLGERAVGWHPCVTPLEVRGLWAAFPAATTLARRLLAHPAAMAGLTGVAVPQGMVLLGAAEALPWADGVVYLGTPPQAPQLRVPTALSPDVPWDLLAAAVLSRANLSRGPVAVLPGAGLLVPLADACVLEAAALQQMLAGERLAGVETPPRSHGGATGGWL